MDRTAIKKEGHFPEPNDQAAPPRCPSCNALPTLVDTMLDPRNGRIIRLYRCTCGERIWDE